MYLTDLAFIEEGTPNYTEDGLVNFSKMRMVRVPGQGRGGVKTRAEPRDRLACDRARAPGSPEPASPTRAAGPREAERQTASGGPPASLTALPRMEPAEGSPPLTEEQPGARGAPWPTRGHPAGEGQSWPRESIGSPPPPEWKERAGPVSWLPRPFSRHPRMGSV